MSEFTQSPNDAPIKVPAEDRFGMDPFAQALAASIRKIKAPEGTVIALNGPWGSGKSSAVNLILHHLKDAIAAGEIAVVNFARRFMPRHRVLSFKPDLRLEWRGQDGQNETEQSDHSASLGDSITSSTRIRFSVHTTPIDIREPAR
jgi:ribose 1,5-bisphosphokinase PhnN